MLESLPEQLVRQLPQLLGQRGCSEMAYSRCASAMLHLVHCASTHKGPMLAELEADLLRWAFRFNLPSPVNISIAGVGF